MRGEGLLAGQHHSGNLGCPVIAFHNVWWPKSDAAVQLVRTPTGGTWQKYCESSSVLYNSFQQTLLYRVDKSWWKNIEWNVSGLEQLMKGRWRSFLGLILAHPKMGQQVSGKVLKKSWSFCSPDTQKMQNSTMRAFFASGLERKSRLTTLVCLLCTSWLPNHAALQQWGLLSAQCSQLWNVQRSFQQQQQNGGHFESF